MILPDVNVLVYAHRQDGPEYPRYRRWLEEAVASDASFPRPALAPSAELNRPRLSAYCPTTRTVKVFGRIDGRGWGCWAVGGGGGPSSAVER